jgi:hypothetical protein
MTVEPKPHDIEAHWTRIAYHSETILVEDDDVEAHGVLAVCAAVVVLAGSAGGTFLANTGTALAPEPAQLTQSLSGTTGATGAAVYVNTQQQTQVVKWPSTYTATANPLPPGTPCSTGALAAGAVTSKVIQALGTSNYRRCV